jgi:hypothetical protein
MDAAIRAVMELTRFLLCPGVDIKAGIAAPQNMDSTSYLSQNAFEGDYSAFKSSPGLPLRLGLLASRWSKGLKQG